jgi:hypothetical protein
VSPRRYGLALAAIAAVWLALRIFYWNGYYTEDAPGYVTDAIWAALGNYHARDHVNGLNVGTYLPVALPIRVFGKSEIALPLWPLACSLLGLLSMAGVARALFGRACGLLAAFLYATYPGDVFFSTVVMPDAIQAGWLTCSMFLIAKAHDRLPARTPIVVAAGVAMGVCHLVRANDVQLLPIGVFAAMAMPMLNGRRWQEAVTGAMTYLAGWICVISAEGLAYSYAAGDFMLRLHVVQQHYGTLDSIARAGLNVDPHTIPVSLVAPAWWWFQGGWGQLNQDQAYHGLLFTWSAALLGAAVAFSSPAASRLDRRKLGGLMIAAVWLLWPILYHQYGSQSLTHWVPMHRLSRHLVVYAPGAIFAIAAGVRVISDVIIAARVTMLKPAAWLLGSVAMVVHLHFNLQGERIAYDAFHHVKDTYVRIRSRLPAATREVVADPGDLCFLDFWMNPLGIERVKMVPLAAIDRCDQIHDGAVLTHSNPGWAGGAPVILETVRRLPCLTDPPATWQLLYEGYPERVFVIGGDEGRARH